MVFFNDFIFDEYIDYETIFTAIYNGKYVSQIRDLLKLNLHFK